MINTMSRDELARLIQSGEKFRLVDVLAKESFAQEHIKGSISLPLAEIGKRAGKLFKKDEKIVVYCASFQCTASTQAAQELINLGFTNVLDYKGGLQDFKEGYAHLMEGGDFKKTAKQEQLCRSCTCG
ncbi:MAG: rhodanese-like domain-containing protein [Candidatus Omnitrophica bacterium]|nr:rhodanese-like domain-containing protein [Candidatus Omnitrophota bacterium]